jgi:hypothetical protein
MSALSMRITRGMRRALGACIGCGGRLAGRRFNQCLKCRVYHAAIVKEYCTRKRARASRSYRNGLGYTILSGEGQWSQDGAAGKGEK